MTGAAMEATDVTDAGERATTGDRPMVLVAEPLAPAGIDALRARCDVTVADGWSLEELQSRIGEFDALVVRSATKVTEDLIERATRLRVVGRAGVGVDNVDLDAASRRGIVVVNAPTSNVLSVAEHTMGLTLALARNVAEGDASLRRGEWKRSKLGGVELAGRTLVLLGVGRIGQLVAERARAFGMRVVGFDPYLPAERFQGFGIEHAATLQDALGQADVVSLHMPLTPDTRGLIGREQLAMTKAGAVIVNTARGALVDLDALEEAIGSGHIAGAALDVFPTEPPPHHPLFEREGVLITPHLAASTREAQDRAGEQVAEQVVAALLGGVVTSAVNVPAIGAEDLEALQPWVPLTARLARLAAQLSTGPVRSLRLVARGDIASWDVRMLSTGALVGLLAGATDEPVNVVNAPHIAEQRGIAVDATTDDAARTFRSLVEVCVDCTGGGAIEVAGTTIGPLARPWLTRVLGFEVELELVEHMAFFRYADVPGVIGKVGSAFGEAGVNIANMAVARSDSGTALMVVSFDEAPPATVVEQLRTAIDLELSTVVHLG